jgi:hypothetical protein
MSPQNCGSGLRFPWVSPDTSPVCHPTCPIYTSHSLQYPDHQDISWSLPWHFLSWLLHKTCMVAVVPVFRALLPALSRKSAVQVHLQIWEAVTLSWTSAAGCISLGKGQDPLPGRNVKSQTIPQIVGVDGPLVLKIDTQETENLDKAISLDQYGASMCSLLLSKHARTKWVAVALPYILTWDLSRSKVHSLSQLAKRLGGWVMAYSLAGSGVQESGRRSKDPLNMQVTGDLRNF